MWARLTLRKIKKQIEEGTFGNGEALGRSLARLLSGRCPIEGGTLDGHLYCLLAVFSIEPPDLPEELRAFLEALQEERWQDCGNLTTFDPAKDVLQAFLVKCPTGQAFWLLRKSPVELFAADELLMSGIASDEGVRNLEMAGSGLSLSWRPFPSGR